MTPTEWFERYPDLGRVPVFTLRLRLSRGNASIRVFEGEEYAAVGTQHTHTTLYCELKAKGVHFPRERFYVGVPLSHCIDSDYAREAVLSLFALKPGDTDSEFFSEYTPEQLAFAEAHGEELSLIALDRYGEP